MICNRYVPADVTSVIGELSVQVWGTGNPITIDLHSGHPLQAGDRVWLAEIAKGIWMSMGPIASSVDYFPDREDPEPLQEPDPLTITAGTVVRPDEDKVNLNNGLTCPYDGVAPADPEEKVLVLVDDDENCTEAPDNPIINPPRVPRDRESTGTVFLALNTSRGTEAFVATTGDVLYANVAGFTDISGNAVQVTSFAWYLDNVLIPGQMLQTLVLTADLIGRVRVTVTGTSGIDTYTKSSGFVQVSPPEDPELPLVNTPATGQVRITGDTRQGGTISADISSIADVNGLAQVVWEYNWAVGTATAFEQDFTIPSGTAVGTLISITVNFTDDAGFRETKIATARVTGVTDNLPTGLPSIAGTPRGGLGVIARTSAISDADGLTAPNFQYDWQLDGVSIASSALWSIPRGTPPGTLTVDVTFTDDDGNTYTRTSPSVQLLQTPNTPATGAPTIRGSVTERGLVSSTPGTIADVDGISGLVGSQFRFQWILNGVPTAQSGLYQIPDGTAGQRLVVTYRFTDNLGNDEMRSSEPVTIGERTRAPEASATLVAATSTTANIRVTALNPDEEWQPTTSVNIRRSGTGPPGTPPPIVTETVRFSQFTNNQYDFLIRNLTPETRNTFIVYANNIPVATIVVETPEASGPVIVEMQRYFSTWYTFAASVRVANWNSGTTLTVTTRNLDSLRESSVSSSLQVTKNFHTFNFVGLTPCSNYLFTAVLRQNGVIVDSATLEWKLRKATQDDLRRAEAAEAAATEARKAALRVDSLYEGAINRLELARKDFLEAADEVNLLDPRTWAASRRIFQRGQGRLQDAQAQLQLLNSAYDNLNDTVQAYIVSASRVTRVASTDTVELIGDANSITIGAWVAAGLLSGVGAFTTLEIAAGTVYLGASLGRAIANSIVLDSARVGVTSPGVLSQVEVALRVFGRGAITVAKVASAIVKLSPFLNVLTGLQLAAFVLSLEGEANNAADAIYRPAVERRNPRSQQISFVAEAGVLLDIRELLAEYRATPVSDSALLESLGQATAFANAVRIQVNRTTC